MKILELKAAEAGALADGAYSFADTRGEPARLSAITGSAVSGKSTLLEAIVAAKETIGPYGGLGSRFNALRRAGAEAAKLESRWRLSEPEQAAAQTPERDVVAATNIADAARLAPDCSPQIRSLFSDDAPAPAGGGLAWFPATRMLVNGRRPPPPMPALWLTRDNRRFESLVLDAATAIQADILASAEAARVHGLFPGTARGVLSDVREALLPFLRDKALQGVRVGDGSAELLFVDRAGRVTTTEHLAASERQGVLFTLALRARPALHGVVLIDEPELHIHPSDHARFLAAVVALAPDAQVIVATSSPAIVAAADATIDLDRRRA